MCTSAFNRIESNRCGRKKGKINQKRQTKEWEAIRRSRYKGINATIDYYSSKFETQAADLLQHC